LNQFIGIYKDSAIGTFRIKNGRAWKIGNACPLGFLLSHPSPFGIDVMGAYLRFSFLE